MCSVPSIVIVECNIVHAHLTVCGQGNESILISYLINYLKNYQVQITINSAMRSCGIKISEYPTLTKCLYDNEILKKTSNPSNFMNISAMNWEEKKKLFKTIDYSKGNRKYHPSRGICISASSRWSESLKLFN